MARYTTEQIRAHLLSRPGAVEALNGNEATEREIEGRDDYGANEWHVYGTMPNTNQDGWYFAGYTAEIVRDMRFKSG
jgi:hypothetical protein